MCQPIRAPMSADAQGRCFAPCGCGCVPPFRRYYSTGEAREYLEHYREQLKKELAGVEERIDEMDK